MNKKKEVTNWAKPLAAAETWNVETLRSETWCPKRKSRNVTPYRSENDISGFQHVETWEPLSWAPLTPPSPKTGYPPPKRGHFRGFVNKNPLWNVDLGQRWAGLLHVSCWALFSSGFAILLGWYLVQPPPQKNWVPPQNVVLSGVLLIKPPLKRRSWAEAGQIDARVILGFVFKWFREPARVVSCSPPPP